MSSSSEDTLPNVKLFNKKRPDVKDEVKKVLRNFPTHSTNYVKSLFPITGWVGRYNMTWLSGDLIAGLTVGAVVVPQGIAYAKVANLPPQYGLYSSFVGVLIYFMFGTSKDITIGPTAVMSLLTGQTLAQYSSDQNLQVKLASTFAFFSGIISLVLGLLRLGFVVDFIPAPAIAGFTTGSAITIAIGQIPKLMGIPNITTTDPCYLVLGHTLEGLPKTDYNAIFGFLTLIYLYCLKYGSRYATKRWPSYEKLFFFVEILRNVTAVIITTLLAYVVNKGKKSPIAVLGTIPPGILVSVPSMDSETLNDMGSTLIVITFILILEHVAISKSFGRINDYKITESQEFVAIGIANTIGSFFHSYPTTGSFSRTAIQSKSGSRTPLAGIFSGVIVIIALYSTSAFYYIPNAALSAIVIHAVLGLVSPLGYVKQLWNIEFWDFSIFIVGLIVTFFTTVEIGIIVSIIIAAVVLLIRIARPRLDSLGRLSLSTQDGKEKYAYVPIDHPEFESAVDNPPDGVLIFRLRESLTYPNSNFLDSRIVEYARKSTKRFYEQAENEGDRPWNELPNEDEELDEARPEKPRLNAVIYDLTAVSVIDSTGLQALSDIRKALNKYADKDVEFHFANIIDEKIEETLIYAGFGFLNEKEALEALNGSKYNDEEKVIGEASKKYFHMTIDEAIASATNTQL